MKPILIALALASVVAGCSGGNPIGSSDSGVGKGTQPLIPEAEVEEASATTRASSDVYGGAINTDLTLNDVTYDSGTGELVLNNMPFDGATNVYTREATGSDALASVGSNFDVYRNVGGPSNYFAVFRRSDSGFSQVTAAGTDRYVTFGFGGVSAQRLSGSGRVADQSQDYTFTGEYAAVRTIVDATTGSQIQYVAGTARIDVDFEDFDTKGAVEGVIVDRTFFDANGLQISDLDGANFISLSTSEINFDTWTIASGTATVFQEGQSNATGNWQGLFTGPNGEEVAGIVFVEGSGPIGIDPDTGEFIEVSVRESGVFVAER